MRLLLPLLVFALMTAGVVVFLHVTSPTRRSLAASRRAAAQALRDREASSVVEAARSRARSEDRLGVADARASRVAGEVVAVLQDPLLDSLPAQVSAPLLEAHAAVSVAAEEAHENPSAVSVGRYETALGEVESQGSDVAGFFRWVTRTAGSGPGWPVGWLPSVSGVGR